MGGMHFFLVRLSWGLHALLLTQKENKETEKRSSKQKQNFILSCVYERAAHVIILFVIVALYLYNCC
jgi:hypothetical protein